jgi:hypothetical protein
MTNPTNHPPLWRAMEAAVAITINNAFPIKVLEGGTEEVISFLGLRVILTNLPDLLVVGHSAKG